MRYIYNIGYENVNDIQEFRSALRACLTIPPSLYLIQRDHVLFRGHGLASGDVLERNILYTKIRNQPDKTNLRQMILFLSHPISSNCLVINRTG